MTLKNIMETSKTIKVVNVFKMQDSDRKELKKLIHEDLEEMEFYNAFLKFCAEINNSNNYIRQKETIEMTGTELEIVQNVKARTKETLILPNIRIGDIVKVAGIPFVKLDDGDFVELKKKY